jgi:hypothetical protein
MHFDNFIFRQQAWLTGFLAVCLRASALGMYPSPRVCFYDYTGSVVVGVAAQAWGLAFSLPLSGLLGGAAPTRLGARDKLSDF